MSVEEQNQKCLQIFNVQNRLMKKLLTLLILIHCSFLLKATSWDSTMIRYQIKFVLLYDAYSENAWDSTEISNYLNHSIDYIRIIKLESNIYPQRYNFYNIFFELPSKHTDSNNEDSILLRLTHLPNRRFIICIDTIQNKLYRIEGFLEDDIFEFFTDIQRISGTIIKSRIDNYYIDKVNMRYIFKIYNFKRRYQKKIRNIE